VYQPPSVFILEAFSDKIVIFDAKGEQKEREREREGGREEGREKRNREKSVNYASTLGDYN